MLDRLTGSLEFQTQALVLRAERQRVIAGNIANADTPGYAARDVDFTTALREAAARGKAGAATASADVARTASGHIGGRLASSQLADPAGTRLGYTVATQGSVDQNTVDMDRERASFVDNSVRYEATLRFINSGVRTMLHAIQGQ